MSQIKIENSDEGVVTKNLAVFENVLTKEKQKKRKKFMTHRFSDDDDESSPSETELVIDEIDGKDEVPNRKRLNVRRFRYKEEPLKLRCYWDSCELTFCHYEIESYFKHIVTHIEDCTETSVCKWLDCPKSTDIHTFDTLIRHLSYHGYLQKLTQIGDNIVERNNLPECNLESEYLIDIREYLCEWKDCYCSFNTIFAYLGHVEAHAQGEPTGKANGFSEMIPCQWKSCESNGFPTRYKLIDHLRVHTKEKMLACSKCFRLFSTKSTFSEHRMRQIKTNLRSYQCSQCLKLFPTEKQLRDHMRSHINHYKCPMCDMTSTKPSLLAKHYRYKHLNERPFSCEQCGKTFVAKCNLNTHLLTHQDKPYKCNLCDFGCKSKGGLKNHMVKVHSTETTLYECQVCKHLFKRGDYLTSHLMKFHKFHWPSGHSRFRYRKDSDGICRLQTVRYESLEVTEEMIRSESMQSGKISSDVSYKLHFNTNDSDGYKVTVVEEGNTDTVQEANMNISQENKVDVLEEEKRNVIITIEDVDETGNIVKRQEFGSNVILVDKENTDGQLVKRIKPELQEEIQ